MMASRSLEAICVNWRIMTHSRSIVFVALLCFAEVFNNISGFDSPYLRRAPSNSERCPQLKVLTASKGVIKFPLFGNYDNNLDCSWQITASAGMVVRFQVESIAIESTTCRCCLYDWLSLYDGSTALASSLMAKLCGTVVPSTPFTTKSNAALVTFTSNSRKGDKGFRLSYQVVSKTKRNSGIRVEDIEGCNGETAILREEEGILTSPNFGPGRKYPNGASCSWLIVVRKPLKVFLKIVKFSLEPPLVGNECHDVLSIYDGPSSSSPIFGSFCGRHVPNDMLSSGNQLYLEFTTDEEGETASGFLIEYSAKDTSADKSECGVPDILPNAYSRIVGGVEATPHSWPWLVQIQVFVKNRWTFWCGGAVLYPQWIITAAHCAKDLGPPSYFKVILGDHNQRKTEGMEETWDVEEIYIHQRYDNLTNDDDIALFRLPSEIQYSHYIKPICLPKTDVGDDVLCIVAGWGQRQGTGVPDVLNQVNVPVINREQCNQPDWYDGRITNNMFCAGYPEGHKDSCQGDSGGPLACQSDGTWVVSGITSFGDGCALSKRPGVYTRVTKYLRWIKKITGI